MSTWQEFYDEIRDPSWPDCPTEAQFVELPDHIQRECQEVFGYIPGTKELPGAFKKSIELVDRPFPIDTPTICQLKWNSSTVFLTTEETASCHRTELHRFDTDSFDFHNTWDKEHDRKLMLDGKWPVWGCDHCRIIEQAGGHSPRIINLDSPGVHAPLELESNIDASRLTPRIVEVYFDNTCDLKCVYCGPKFSSAWDKENQQFGQPAFVKSANIESNKKKMFEWLKANGRHLTNLNINGGEPLYQPEFNECIELFDQYPATELCLQIITNLNCELSHLQTTVERIKQLVNQGKIKEFKLVASLDGWGAEQEYVRYPLNLQAWEKNFEYLLEHPWINLTINSTVTVLTIKTLPALLTKIQQWNTRRLVNHCQNNITEPKYLRIDALNNPELTTKLYDFLNKMDQRRSTNWAKTFPWLVEEFQKHQ
jgi:hypothetical protein